MPPRLLALLLCLRLLKRGLQFLHALIDVLLPLRQFLQAIQNGELFLLLLILRLLRLALRLVALLLILHLQFIELRAILLALLALAFALLLAGHAKLMRREFQQRIIGSLLRRERIRERHRRLLRHDELLQCAVHLQHHDVDQSLRLRVLDLLRHLRRHAERLRLRILHDRLVLEILLAQRRRSGVVFGALQIPRRADNLLLQFRELRRFLAGTAALLRLSGTLVARPVDFLKWPHLGKKHVALRAARLPVWADIIRPQMPRHEFVHLHADVLQLEHMLESEVLVRLGITHERHLLRPAARDRVLDASRRDAEVIPRLGAKRDLLDRRHARVALRRDDLQLRTPVRQRIERETHRQLVRAPLGILQFQLPHFAFAHREIAQFRDRLRRVHRQRHDRSILRHERCGLHGFVQLELHMEARSLHGAHPARVGDQLLRQLRKLGILDARIRPIQPRKFKHLHVKIARGTAGVLHAVGRIRLHLGNTSAENRIIEILHERDALRRLIRRAQEQRRLARHVALKFCENHEPTAALKFHITGRDADFLHLHIFVGRRVTPKCFRQPRERNHEQRQQSKLRRPRASKLPARHGLHAIAPAHFGYCIGDHALLKKMQPTFRRLRLLLDGSDEQSMKIGMPLLDTPRDHHVIRLP